jgi:antitoxin (DNA-binding transcriptional repressor) of toxin-antitoxin stability system
MQQVDLNEAKMHLSDLIEAAIEGEEVVIGHGSAAPRG